MKILFVFGGEECVCVGGGGGGGEASLCLRSCCWNDEVWVLEFTLQFYNEREEGKGGEIEPLWGRFRQQTSWWPGNENDTDWLRGGRSVDRYVGQGWRCCQRVGCVQLESLLGGVWAVGQSPGTPPGLPGVSEGNSLGVCQIDSDPVSSCCQIDKDPISSYLLWIDRGLFSAWVFMLFAWRRSFVFLLCLNKGKW